MLHKAWNSKGEMPYCSPRSSIKFQGHTGQNITDFDPNWAFPDYRPVAAFKSLRFALLTFEWYLFSQVVNADNLTYGGMAISYGFSDFQYFEKKYHSGTTLFLQWLYVVPAILLTLQKY